MDNKSLKEQIRQLYERTDILVKSLKRSEEQREDQNRLIDVLHGEVMSLKAQLENGDFGHNEVK